MCYVAWPALAAAFVGRREGGREGGRERETEKSVWLPAACKGRCLCMVFVCGGLFHPLCMPCNCPLCICTKSNLAMSFVHLSVSPAMF